MAIDIRDIENKIRATADEPSANLRLKASDYPIPVLGLIFLRLANQCFAGAEEALAVEGWDGTQTGRTTRGIISVTA